MARSKENLVRELDTRRCRPLQHAESDYDLIFDIVAWFQSLDSEEKECIRNWMGEFAATQPGEVLGRELAIIREIGARAAAGPLEKLCRSIEKSRWRDDILITLMELGCTTALDLYRDRIREFEDSRESYDRATAMSKNQFVARMILVDAGAAVRLLAQDLGKMAKRLRGHRRSLSTEVHFYLSAAPDRLIELLAEVARIDPQAALLVRDALLETIDHSPTNLEDTYGAEARIVCDSIRTWSGS